MRVACRFEPPARVWFKTEHGWASREWGEGERAEYRRRVLYREVHDPRELAELAGCDT